MSVAQLAEVLSFELQEINQILLSTALNDYDDKTIIQIVEHIASSGGKRIRPLLTVAAARLCKATNIEKSIKLATAVECLHTATLLHDDVIDESSLRRGVPTSNALWGNKPSILVGDYLFSKAFYFMTQCHSIQALNILSEASVTISQSEVWQLSLLGKVGLTEAEYLRLIYSKTAVLFIAACEVGGISGNAKEEHLEELRSYAHALGMIFQIMDDILDYNVDNTHFGKVLGNDLFEGKVTLPIILLLNKAEAADKALVISIFTKKVRNKEDLAIINTLLNHYKITEAVIEYAHRFLRNKSFLQSFEDGQLKKILIDILYSMFDRKV